MRRILLLYPRAIAFRRGRLDGGRALLRELGLELVVGEHEVDERVSRGCDRVLELPPPHQAAEAWRVVREYLDREPVDAVVAQSESALLVGSLAARHAGLTGLPPAAAHACANKLVTRRSLERAGVAQPRFALARGRSDVARFAREHGFPVVLKAVSSAAQRLVTLVRDERGLDRSLARLLRGLERSEDVQRLVEFARVEPVELGCDPRRDFLVESFAAGEPVEVDGLVEGSDVRAFGVTDQVHAARPSFFIEGYLFPSDRPERSANAIEDTARRALRALGVRDTSFSVELRAGDDAVRLIEVNGRMGIDEGLGDLYASVLGAHPALLALAQALGEPPTWSRGAVRSALAYRCRYEAGVVESVPAPADAVDGTACVEVHVAPGDAVRSARDPRVRPHLAHALALDARSSRAAYRRARAAVDALHFAIRSPSSTIRASHEAQRARRPCEIRGPGAAR